MEITALLETLRQRAPWRTVASPILKSNGFPVSRGFDDTVEDILQSKLTVQQVKSLEAALIEHLIVGEKLLRVYRADVNERQALLNWANGLKVAPTNLTDAFLKPATEATLAKYENSQPQFVATHEAKNGLGVIFTSARSYLERVDLPASSLAAGVDAASFEKLYGVRKTRIQTYDAIWIPYEEEYVCIAADAPEKAPSDFGNASQIALQASMVRTLSTRLEVFNLWPAIDGVYQAPGGQFVELGFLTDTDSVKLHKSRRGNKCLRSDEYHVGGATVVGEDLQPYRVAVRWKRQIPTVNLTTYPEIQLPGTARMIFGANPQLDHAYVRHCLSVSDLEFVLSKVTPHL